MKRIGAIFCVLVMVLFFWSSAHAQPWPGAYDTRDGDFPAGTWTEILYGMGEGKPGNEILAGAEGYYKFEGAILADVILLGEPTDEQPFYEYRTVYKWGTLTLYNDPLAGWYNVEDDVEYGIDEYVVNLKNTIVVTKKYVDMETGEPTGEIEFSLFVVDARFKNYHGYSASITARFDRGEPELFPYPEDNDYTNTFQAFGGDLSWAIISIKGPEYIAVPVDIKPGSCPNPVNVVSRGVLPVAILGTPDFDVTQIDPKTILLNGIKPLRYAYEDVGTPYEPFKGKWDWDAYSCIEGGPDGYLDLSLKFDTQEFVESLKSQKEIVDKEPVVVELKGNLYDGTPIKGEDVVLILDKARTPARHGMSTVIGSILELIAGKGPKK